MAHRMPGNDEYKKMLIRIPPEIYAILQQRSRAEDRSLNGELIHLVRTALKQEATQGQHVLTPA